jgi:hypothetical protein
MVRIALARRRIGGSSGVASGSSANGCSARRARRSARRAESTRSTTTITAGGNEPRAVVEDAEQSRFLPKAGGRKHGARALVKVQVPEAMNVADFVRAGLAHGERLPVPVLAMAALLGAQKPLLLHEPAHGGGGLSIIVATLS